MSIANLVRLVYVVLGAAYLVAGVGVQLYRSDALNQDAIYVINQVTHDSPTALHILQEFGTHMLALGVIALWFAYNYELSWVFHWAMTIAWGVFGLMHYLDVRGTPTDYKGVLVTAIPFAVFVVLAILRWRSERAF